MVQKNSFKISGMSCAACAARIEKGLGKVEGVHSANVNFAMERATVEYDDGQANVQKFEDVINKLGYGIIKEKTADENKVELKITGMSCQLADSLENQDILRKRIQ